MANGYRVIDVKTIHRLDERERLVDFYQIYIQLDSGQNTEVIVPINMPQTEIQRTVEAEAGKISSIMKM